MAADSVSVLNLLCQCPKKASLAFGKWSALQGNVYIFGLKFEDLGRSGPPHRPLFMARCSVHTCTIMRMSMGTFEQTKELGLSRDGAGTSKKKAKNAAATLFLETLSDLVSGNASVPSPRLTGASSSSAICCLSSNRPSQGSQLLLTETTAHQQQQADKPLDNDKVGSQ